MSKIEDKTKHPFIFIATSGSVGYLKDATSAQRYWPAPSPPIDTPPPSTEDLQRLQRLVSWYVALENGVKLCRS